jgi:hypothetical protein
MLTWSAFEQTDKHQYREEEGSTEEGKNPKPGTGYFQQGIRFGPD